MCCRLECVSSAFCQSRLLIHRTPIQKIYENHLSNRGRFLETVKMRPTPTHSMLETHMKQQKTPFRLWLGVWSLGLCEALLSWCFYVAIIGSLIPTEYFHYLMPNRDSPAAVLALFWFFTNGFRMAVVYLWKQKSFTSVSPREWLTNTVRLPFSVFLDVGTPWFSIPPNIVEAHGEN